MDNKDTVLENFEEAIDNFNFKRVHKAMKALNWKWANNYGQESVPTIKKMKDTCRDLINGIIYGDKEIGSCRTGGFYVSVINIDGLVDISFILEKSVGFVYYEES